MPRPREIFGPCRYCGRRAARRARVGTRATHAVCVQHYNLWLRTGRFTHERRSITRDDLQRIKRLRKSGLTWNEVVKQSGVSRRSMFRALERGVGQAPGWNLTPKR